MEKETIKKYILSQEKIEFPEVQNKFSISYAEMKSVFDELSKENKLEFVSGVTFKIIGKDVINDLFRREARESYSIDDRLREIENRRRALTERLHRMNDFDDEDDDDEYEPEEDREVDLREALIRCLECGLQEITCEKKYILGMEDGLNFELKFVQNGSALRISDCGMIFPAVGQTRRKVKNVLKNYSSVVLEEDGEISITVENVFGTLMALMTLYSAVDAVKKMK